MLSIVLKAPAHIVVTVPVGQRYSDVLFPGSAFSDASPGAETGTALDPNWLLRMLIVKAHAAFLRTEVCRNITEIDRAIGWSCCGASAQKACRPGWGCRLRPSSMLIGQASLHCGRSWRNGRRHVAPNPQALVWLLLHGIAAGAHVTAGVARALIRHGFGSMFGAGCARAHWVAIQPEFGAE